MLIFHTSLDDDDVGGGGDGCGGVGDGDDDDDDLPAQCCSSTRASQLFTLQPMLPSRTFQEKKTEEPLDVALS